ncbi:toxin-antitoxin system, toxin component, GNAT family [Trametes punicea]|nr:toxin-antitoxin system, toxin component, GNAT family [Trametes punicea]
MDLAVRIATNSDLPAILDIYNEQILNGTATFHTEPQTLDERIAWLNGVRAKDYPCMVAEITDESGEKRTVGWCNLWHYKERPAYDGSAEISLYVHKEFRGKGIGAKLLQGLLGEVRKQGNRFHTIIASVTAENARTVTFWQKQGFEFRGTLREVGYKFGRWLDVSYLQLLV